MAVVDAAVVYMLLKQCCSDKRMLFNWLSLFASPFSSSFRPQVTKPIILVKICYKLLYVNQELKSYF